MIYRALRPSCCICLQKTLNPPRLPQRPHPPLRYPIVSTRKLIDLSDAPAPPPRAIPVSNFTTNITKHEVPTEFHTSAIRFTEDNDKAKLKLTLSAHARSLPAPAPPPVPAPVPAPSRTEHRPRPSKSRTQEVIFICVVVLSIMYIAFTSAPPFQ